MDVSNDQNLVETNANEDQLRVQEQKYSELYQQFNKAICMADDIVTKSYLARLTEMDVVEPDSSLLIEKDKNKEAVRLIRIDEMVYSKDENAAHKFASVFGAMTTVENTVFLLIDSDGKKTKFYMGVRCDGEKRSASTQLTTLRNSLQGQFPGIKLTEGDTEYDHSGIVELVKGIKPGAISSVSCVANLRDEETRDNKAFLQGLEKFALSLQGKKYSAIILANSLPQDRLAEVRYMYEQIYTRLSSFSEQQLAYGTNESWNTLVTDSEGTNEGLNWSVGRSKNWGTTINVSKGENTSESKENTASRVLGALGVAAGAVATVMPQAALVAGGAFVAASLLRKTTTTGNNAQQGIAKAQGSAEEEGLGGDRGHHRDHAEASGKSGGTTYTLTLTSKNETILSLMERIDHQLKRMREFESYGMWECSAFFISPELNVSEMAASTYKAIMSGEHTGVEISAVNSWKKDLEPTRNIHKYITNFMQPLFRYRSTQASLDVTAGTFVSGKELALHMGLPRRSIPGFPVIEHAEFAKEPVCYEKNEEDEKSFAIGKIYSMGRAEQTDARLDVNSLTMHTFVTGSTGSGKSNTVYGILNRLSNEHKIPFLVVEPAKGEYKNVFGNAHVFGTNQYLTPLLCLNPFSFVYKPENQSRSIHVLEHIERIIEVFNACWPMYAAMPAILKEAVESAYERVGWNLAKSVSATGEFPTFETLLGELPKIINKTEYSKDTGSDYKGALVTRVNSLTKGLYRQIFGGHDMDLKSLFDENTIIDLSRVQSSETKALIMGIIITKLHEYRATQAKLDGDESLKHVTVLEEAHNLLRRTSTEQTQESSNLQGKSVEMLANAIAEMRTYGEGFIIADQSPGLLDMSVIRNTNTKIIMRLPDESDRMLVGKAAGLTDTQIEELSRLEQGAAAISQSGWLEPVLCKVGLYEKEDKIPFNYNLNVECDNNNSAEEFLNIAFGHKELQALSNESIDAIYKWRDALNLEKSTYELTKKVVSNGKLSEPEKQKLAYDFFGGSQLSYLLRKEKPSDVVKAMDSSFATRYQIEVTSPLIEQVRLLITDYLHAHKELSSFANLLPLEEGKEEKVR